MGETENKAAQKESFFSGLSAEFKRSFGRTTNHLQDRQQPLLLFP